MVRLQIHKLTTWAQTIFIPFYTIVIPFKLYNNGIKMVCRFLASNKVLKNGLISKGRKTYGQTYGLKK